MRIMRALLLLMLIAALAVLAGCGGGGGLTPPDPTNGTVAVVSADQQVVYTPPAGRAVYSVYAYFRNTISSQTISANFAQDNPTGRWKLDISPASTQFNGEASGDYNMTTWVIFMDADQTPYQIGSAILVPDLDILGGSGPPPPPF